MNAPLRSPASIKAVARLDDNEPCYLLSYIGGAKMTMGMYGSVSDAISRSDFPPKSWIPLPDGNWRSENGRQFIHVCGRPDVKPEAA